MTADQNRPRRPRWARGQLLTAEAAVGCLVAGVAFGGPWGHLLATGGAAVAALALVRVRGRWTHQRLLDRLRGGTAAALPWTRSAAERETLGLAYTLLPALDVTEHHDRDGPPLGVLADGRGHAAVLALPSGAWPAIPAEAVARWLTDDPACPAAAQVLVEQFGLPHRDLLHQYQPTAAYRRLPYGNRPVALRSFLVVRYEPFEAPGAAARRGGGPAGARAAVASATARLAARLRAADTPVRPLGADELRDLLRQTGAPSGAGRDVPGGWASDSGTHCTLTTGVDSQAAWRDLLAALATCTAERVVAAATLTRDDAGLRVRTAVRLVSPIGQQAATERDRLVRTGVTGPPAADQAAGLLATLPVGRPPRDLAVALGDALTGPTSFPTPPSTTAPTTAATTAASLRGVPEPGAPT